MFYVNYSLFLSFSYQYAMFLKIDLLDSFLCMISKCKADVSCYVEFVGFGFKLKILSPAIAIVPC